MLEKEFIVQTIRPIVFKTGGTGATGFNAFSTTYTSSTG
jgi:hypothetical protein